MIQFVTSLVGGATLGGVFILVALGMVLVFRATETFNFAHGEMMLLPAYIVGYSQAKGASGPLSIVVAITVAGLIGFLFYALVLRRTTGLPLFMGVIATFGLASILDGVMTLKFGNAQYAISLSALPKGSTAIAGTKVSEASLAIAALTIGIGLVVAAVIRYSRLGILIRAAGQDAILASQSGIPVRRLYALSWIVAGALAALAGILYGSQATVDVSLVGLGLQAIPAMLLGGLDSIDGAIVGGIATGLIESLTQTYLGGNYVNPVVYSVLLIILLLYPQGFFGTKSVVRA